MTLSSTNLKDHVTFMLKHREVLQQIEFCNRPEVEDYYGITDVRFHKMVRMELTGDELLLFEFDYDDRYTGTKGSAITPPIGLHFLEHDFTNTVLHLQVQSTLLRIIAGHDNRL